MIEKFHIFEKLQGLLNTWGASLQISSIISFFSLTFFILLLSWIANIISKKYLVNLIRKVLSKSNFPGVGAIWKHKFIERVAHLAPALVIYFLVPAFHFKGSQFSGSWIVLVQTLVLIYMIFTTALALSSLLDTCEEVYNTYPIAKRRPIKSYLQVLKIIIFLLAVISVISIVIHESPWALITGLSAATAILVIVFKDSILGFVASIQMAMSDIIRIGDWVELPAFGANGDVVEISLNKI